jgi:aspartyl-tRNA(Asn)/glutamyl-tRNA(Gln) amidotransferase subunit A
MEIDLKSLTILNTHEHFKKGDFTPSELTEAYLSQIKKENPDINAYITVFEDAIEAAKESDKRYKDGKPIGVLDGSPIAVKDLILVKGKLATGASKILSNYKATYDATCVTKLKEAGAVILGKTNCDEFGMGASNENSAYGPVKNPIDRTRVAGGSSGGSVAAVAADMALSSLGTDTGGSVRLPSAFCGLVGLRTTYDVMSRYGVMALSSSLDQVGPVTKTVVDSEILFKAIAGKDEMDSTSEPYEFRDTDKLGIDDLTIGIPKDLPTENLDPRVLKNYKDSIEKLKSLGYKTKEVTLPHAKYAISAYYIILPAEVSTNLSRLDGLRYGSHKDGHDLLGDYMNSRGEGFGKETRRRVILGTYVLSAGYYDSYYGKAIMVRELIKQDFEKAFEEVDAIIMPTATSPAFKIGEKVNDPVAMYLVDLYLTPQVLAGIPSISIPSGTIEEEGKDLPLGIQIMAPRFREDVCFKIGKDFEKK